MPRYTQGFESAREAKRHWDAHSDLLGLKTLDEYVERADTFLGAPLAELPGVEECQRPLGDWVRYNLRTQELGTMSEDRVFIKTHFISERRYWRGRTFREREGHRERPGVLRDISLGRTRAAAASARAVD